VEYDPAAGRYLVEFEDSDRKKIKGVNLEPVQPALAEDTEDTPTGPGGSAAPNSASEQEPEEQRIAVRMMPAAIPMGAVTEVEVSCSMGDTIEEVLVAGRPCEVLESTASTAVVRVGPFTSPDEVEVEVRARHLDRYLRKQERGLKFYQALRFGMVGFNCKASADCRRVFRNEGIVMGTCFSSEPVARFDGGQAGSCPGWYFEVAVVERQDQRSIRSLALGFRFEDTPQVASTRDLGETAKTLPKALMLGYDPPQLVVNGNTVKKTDSKLWRPHRDVGEGDRLGLFLTDSVPQQVAVFQNGVERLRLPVELGHGPSVPRFAVFDVCGQVSGVEFIDQAAIPALVVEPVAALAAPAPASSDSDKEV